MNEAVFERSGELFVPTPSATGPWAADRLHGGPVLGLLARAIEAAVDPELVCARLTVDMFRPVPHAPLGVRSEIVRQGGRLMVLQASLFAEQTEMARASALFLRESDLDAATHSQPPGGFEELPTESLMRGMRDPRVPRGFHTRVETRWVPRAAGDPLAIWFRLPMPLVAAEPASALQRAITLSDFANAVSSIAESERQPRITPYINTDATLYFSRRPQGEWFCLRELDNEAERGISVAGVSIADQRGPFGRVLQARLALTR
jgi:Thioesterase-like superfamily